MIYFLVNPMNAEQVIGIQHRAQGYLPQREDKHLDQNWCDAVNERNGISREDALLAFRLSLSPSLNPTWDLLHHLVK